MKRLMNILLTLLGAYILMLLILFLMQRQMIFFPDPNLVLTPDHAGLEWSDVYMETEDGVSLHAWYLPHPESESVLLFSHGNAGNISHRLELLERFHDRGISTLIYDYRGYGRSEGRPSERGLYRDVRAAWKYLTEEKGYEPRQVILFGRSLGGSVSSRLATRVEPGGLVLESSFTSARDVAADIYPFIPSSLVRFRFDAAADLQKVNCPVLVMHSRDDSIIGFHHGERLYKAAPEPKTFVELRGGHNDNFLVSGDLYFEALQQFVIGTQVGSDTLRNGL